MLPRSGFVQRAIRPLSPRHSLLPKAARISFSLIHSNESGSIQRIGRARSLRNRRDAFARPEYCDEVGKKCTATKGEGDASRRW